MRIESRGEGLVLWSPSKVNLFLEIKGKRDDGYHELVTVMQVIDLCDELDIQPSSDDRIHFRCDHPAVPSDTSNLVVRAALELQKLTGHSTGVSMSLRKLAPVGGGIGSGSGNAAAALLGLNRFWYLGLDTGALHQVAASLGSDINFFLEEGLSLCTGRGERVQPLASVPLHYVLLMPRFGVSTAEVFRAMPPSLNKKNEDVNILLKALENRDFSAICGSLFNRLESPAFSLHPDLGKIKSRLENIAPGRALMSGSGSTMYVLCPEADVADSLEEAIAELNLGRVYRTASADEVGQL